MSRWGRLLNINLLTEDYRVAVLIRNTISFFLVLDNGHPEKMEVGGP